jgi:Protein of unknown function (Porph_ging).
MKRFYFLFVALLSLPAFAQITISIGNEDETKNVEIDKSVLRITYKASSLSNPKDTADRQEDIMVLEIGENDISRFYSDNKRRMDSLVRVTFQRGAANIDMPSLMKENGIGSGGKSEEIYMNYPKNKLTLTDHILTSSYLCEEELNLLSWEIKPESKEILNYVCQKAESQFRGRHYEAWFAPELPISSGPWKFRGLPGVILEVRDFENHYAFEAIGIEQADSPILFPEKKYVKASRKEIEKIKKRMNDDPMGYINNAFPKGNVIVKFKDQDGNTLDKPPVRPYNPIEREEE